MDRITESLLAEFSEEFDLKKLPEDKRFEHFASYVTVKRHHSEHFDTTDVVTGSGSDTGIDAIAVIVNGEMIYDVDELVDAADNSSVLDVTFIFVQAERSSAFDAAKIGTFSFGVLDFFKSTPSLPRNDRVKQMAEVMNAIYERSSKFKRGNPNCRLFYVTTGQWVGDDNLEARRQAAIADLKGTQLFGDIEFGCIGADGIQRRYNETKNAISREFVFGNRVEIPEIQNVTEAYLGYVPISQFRSIITDDDGGIVRSIFYDNVRDWQEYNTVNTEMRDTLMSPERARFVLMNNGVTVIARSLHKTASRFHIEDFQIVNGCQTSHVLFEQNDLTDEVCIPLRLIVTQDEEVIESIIRATNRQTALKEEQFLALTEFSKKLEAFFASYPVDKRLYYERRSCQYDRLDIEKTRIVTPANAIRSFAAMYLSEPHRTTRNYRALTDKVGTDIFADSHRLDPYYVSSFALYKLEYLFRSQKLEAKYKPARFHILLAVRLLFDISANPPMNSHEISRRATKLAEALWDNAQADDLFSRAAAAVEHVAGGDFDRDTIRTQPFTDSIIKYCQEQAVVS